MTSATLRILATTDLHAHALGWDYFRDEPRHDIGLASLVPLIRQARSECPSAVLLDNGDFLQGSQLGDWSVERGTGKHPMIAAMNALAYDAATLGNHEFSHGLDVLQSVLAEADFPVVSANLAVSGLEGLTRSTLLTRMLPDADGRPREIRIGVTGIAPPQTAIWEARNLKGRLRAEHPISAARHAITGLREQGADIVVLLAHTGIGDGAPGTENLAVPLSDLSGADVLVLGHTHLTYPDGQTVLSAPAVMPGCFGSHLGCVDLEMRHGADGWSIAAATPTLLRPQADPRPVPEALPAETLHAHESTRAWLRQPVGNCDVPLHAHFARIAPSSLVRLVAAAQADHVRIALGEDRIAGRPVLGAAAPFRTGTRGAPGGCTDIAAGQLTLRHLNDIYPHPNSVVALALTGAEIADWLERAVIQFTTLSPADPDRPVLRRHCPTFDFDIIDGLSFGIDLTVPPRFDQNGTLVAAEARRIFDLRHDGKIVRKSDAFIVATNSHRASGSGGFPACVAERILLDDDTCSRQAVANFLGSGQNPWRRKGGGGWYFATHPGLSAVFDASSGAEDHLADIEHLHPETLPRSGTSTAPRFRLWFGSDKGRRVMGEADVRRDLLRP